jgi:hypothetical protein
MVTVTLDQIGRMLEMESKRGGRKNILRFKIRCACFTRLSVNRKRGEMNEAKNRI